MQKVSSIFSRSYGTILREPYFWAILFLQAIIGIIYYTLQFHRIEIFQISPLAQDLVIWEYIHNLIGSLFYIPILISITLFWWRGTIVTWLLSMCILLPRLTYFYGDNLSRILLNILNLAFPLLLLAFIAVEISWRNKERAQLAEREQERQNYLAEIFRAQERERAHLAREIHDDPIQRLTAIAINAKLLTNNDELTNLPATRKGIEALRDTVISVSQDLRRITLDLRPTVLDDLGLVPAIRWLVKGFQEDNGIDTQLEILGEEPPISRKYATNIFRIIQEALNNIRKHAKATRVNITLQYTDDLIEIIVQDNGIGFNLPKTDGELTSQSKLGLLGMRQRAQILDGTIHFESERRMGTRLTLQVRREPPEPEASSSAIKGKESYLPLRDPQIDREQAAYERVRDPLA
jgi:signal transduction histidine kinase